MKLDPRWIATQTAFAWLFLALLVTPFLAKAFAVICCLATLWGNKE